MLASQGRQEPSVLASEPVLVVGVAVENPSSPVVIRWLVSKDLMKLAIVLTQLRTWESSPRAQNQRSGQMTDDSHIRARSQNQRSGQLAHIELAFDVASRPPLAHWPELAFLER